MDPKRLRTLVSRWPGVTEDVKWGNDLVLSVGGKMFCVTRSDGKGAMSFKVPDERFLELTDREGIVPAPYLAKSHWVMVERDGALPRDELEALVRGSYELVRAKLTKKLQREYAD
jgi:predicted DNA-binding protein (MmcQ/YjbR family)